MQQRLYVGNLSYDAKEEELRTLFSKYGTVQSVSLISDRRTGRSKGFAFVEMSTGEESQKALELNGTDFMGRALQIAEARPQEPRQAGGHGGSRGPSFGRGGERRHGGGPSRHRGGFDRR